MVSSHQEGFPSQISEDPEAIRLAKWREAFSSEAGCAVNHAQHEIIQASQTPEYVQKFIARKALNELDDELKAL